MKKAELVPLFRLMIEARHFSFTKIRLGFYNDLWRDLI